MKMFLRKNLAFSFFVLLIGFAGGTGAALFWSKPCHHGYNLINKELSCDNQPAIDKSEYTEFKNGIITFLEQKVADKSITNAAVYFRDLQNGPTFGINEKEKFVGASLLKLPILITYLATAEDDPAILYKKVVFRKIDDSQKSFAQYFKPREKLEQLKPYTINELLYRLISFSDNDANDVLLTYLNNHSINEDKLLKTYHELGIIPPTGGIDEALSIKQYAGIFRNLYNASYLSKEMSEKALTILSQSEFKEGIESGVPQDTIVAQKFGERTYANGQKIERQLHDCGIIYYPDNPYLLCVMTKGYEFDTMVSVIKSISEKVYQEIKSRDKRS